MNDNGFLHGNGLGVLRDLNAAQAWLKKAADLGDPQAMENLRGAGMIDMKNETTDDLQEQVSTRISSRYVSAWLGL